MRHWCFALFVTVNGMFSSIALAQTDDAFTPSPRIAIRERLTSYWQSLDLTARTLAFGPVPEAWGAGLFLDVPSLNGLLSQIDMTFQYDGAGPLAGTSVQVTHIKLLPKPGALDAELNLVAEKAGFSLPLNVAARVTYQGITKPPSSAASELTLRIEPTEVSPNFASGWLNWVKRSFWRNLLPDLTLLLADPHLFEVRFQIPDRITIPFGFQKQETVLVNGGEGTVSYTAAMEPSSLTQQIAYAGPVFTDRGIWLLAKLGDAGTQVLVPETVPSLSVSELQERVSALEAAISVQLARAPLLRGGAELYVGKSLLLALTDKLERLDPAKRRVTFTTTGQSGYLAGRRQSMGILGNLGIQAVLLDKTGTGDVQFDFGKAQWTSDALTIPMNASMHAKANVELNVDVIASGIVRTSVGIVGEGSASVAATAKPSILGTGPQRVAVLEFPGTCAVIRADIKTDGVLKTDVGWTKVPSIGGRITTPVGPLPPLLLLDGRPQLVKLPPKRFGSWMVLPRHQAVALTLVPDSFQGTSDGLNLAIALTADPIDSNQSAEERV